LLKFSFALLLALSSEAIYLVASIINISTSFGLVSISLQNFTIFFLDKLTKTIIATAGFRLTFSGFTRDYPELEKKINSILIRSRYTCRLQRIRADTLVAIIIFKVKRNGTDYKQLGILLASRLSPTYNDKYTEL
jgi:hypothetical protein